MILLYLAISTYIDLLLFNEFGMHYRETYYGWLFLTMILKAVSYKVIGIINEDKEYFNRWWYQDSRPEEIKPDPIDHTIQKHTFMVNLLMFGWALIINIGFLVLWEDIPDVYLLGHPINKQLIYPSTLLFWELIITTMILIYYQSLSWLKLHYIRNYARNSFPRYYLSLIMIMVGNFIFLSIPLTLGNSRYNPFTH